MKKLENVKIGPERAKPKERLEEYEANNHLDQELIKIMNQEEIAE
jgi:hypothetical protein